MKEQIESHLVRGRAYVPGAFEFSPREACDLVLVHPISGQWLPLRAEAVYQATGPSPGIGLQIVEEGEQWMPLLLDFASEPSHDPEDGDGDDLGDREGADWSESLLSDRDAPAAPLSSPPSDRQATPAVSAAERVRGLNSTGRDRVARRGVLAERIALERAYGPAVWESLLSNPLLSTAEVARIAKNHTASQPILNLIVSNAAWLVKPEVRRALLSNPRLTESQVERTLRALPMPELKMAVRQLAYPVRVRNAAKRLLGL